MFFGKDSKEDLKLYELEKERKRKEIELKKKHKYSKEELKGKYKGIKNKGTKNRRVTERDLIDMYYTESFYDWY